MRKYFRSLQTPQPLEIALKTIAVLAVSLCLAGAAMAQTPAPATGPADTAGATCQSQVAAKKLKGAALTSSATKCCKDAATAAKLKGAAATSFTKKCVADATKA
ncbi:MAG: hypothetical protein WAM75_09530 [Xanthobacteraceae bacterium]